MASPVLILEEFCVKSWSEKCSPLFRRRKGIPIVKKDVAPTGEEGPDLTWLTPGMVDWLKGLFYKKKPDDIKEEPSRISSKPALSDRPRMR